MHTYQIPGQKKFQETRLVPAFWRLEPENLNLQSRHSIYVTAGIFLANRDFIIYRGEGL